jgi:riboflavin kinase/FMN adenylyltransferase
MELIRGLHSLAPRHRGCVATIGNFDGVHLGHQTVISQLAAKAAQHRLPSTVILFEPQPLEFFRAANPPARLMRLRDKLEALAQLGVDRVLCLRFNAALAEMSADAFIRHVLVEGLGVRYLTVGDDFRFGAERRGDFDMLTAAGGRDGFEVAATHTVLMHGVRISSTRVREALATGNLALAQQLLGRPYAISGHVIHGEKLGRTLAVPTANLLPLRRVVPVRGVFVVEVSGLKRERAQGVASLGTRPTVGGNRLLLEVHLFDFNAEVYGHRISVHFLHKIRDEERFDSVEELRQWMERDIAQARAFFVAKSGAIH